MKKLYKILLCVFAAGILLCGLGVGVAFTEFSGLSYGGEQIIGKENMKLENFDVRFEPGEEKTEVYIRNWYYSNIKTVLDESVPENTVRFAVKYNSKGSAPYAHIDKEGKVFLNIYYNYSSFGDELALFFEEKDLFLQNLKEKKLVSVTSVMVEEVTVHINPASADSVEIMDW